jgi:hypothetical protein
MTSNHSKFDDTLRRRLAGYEMAPEGYVLENIFSHEAMQSRRRTRRRFFFILFFLLSGSSLTTMALMLNREWFGSNNSLPTIAQVASSSAPSPATQVLNIPEVSQEVVVETATPGTAVQSGYFSRNQEPGASISEPVEEVTVSPISTDERVEVETAAPMPSSSPALHIGTVHGRLGLRPASPVWEVETQPRVGSAFYLGPHVLFSRTAILNDAQFSTYDGTALSPKTDFGVMFGVTAGYCFRNRIGIETGVNFLSIQGQKYEGLVGGKHISQEIMLSYQNFPVYLKLKHQVGKGDLPIVVNAMLGGHYGRLKRAQLLTNDLFPIREVTEEISQREVAFGGGVEADFYIDSRLYITLGVRSTLSKDISGPLRMSNEHMRNLLVGANFGLNFTIVR